MRHRIIHDTVFRYDQPVHESVMEVRLNPGSNEHQRCEEFVLTVTPKTVVHTYVDAAQNIINHFQIPGRLTELHVSAQSTVDVYAPAPLPTTVPQASWDAFEEMRSTSMLDMMLPSTHTRPSASLDAFMSEHNVQRDADPLTTVQNMNTVLYQTIHYTPQSTTIDSTIEEVLAQRKGVCQDISHLMI